MSRYSFMCGCAAARGCTVLRGQAGGAERGQCGVIEGIRAWQRRASPDPAKDEPFEFLLFGGWLCHLRGEVARDDHDAFPVTHENVSGEDLCAGASDRHLHVDVMVEREVCGR
jgi:hypothetical protein